MGIGYHPVRLWLGIAAMMLGFWAVFWPPSLLDEAPWFAAGLLLLAGGSVLTSFQLSARPVASLEERTAPAEIEAWLTLLYTGAIGAWVVSHRHMLMGGWTSVATKQVGFRLLMVAVFYVVVLAVLRMRRGAAVLQDERDRSIGNRAAQWGRGVLIYHVVAIVFMFGFSPADRLAWATPPAVATALLFALIVSWAIESAAKVAMYRIGRQ